MNNRIRLLFTILLCFSAFILAEEEHIELIRTYDMGDSVGVAVTLSSTNDFEEQVFLTPPHVKLVFAGSRFAYQRYSEQINLDVLYHIDVREKILGLNQVTTEVVLYFSRMPNYRIVKEFPEYIAEYMDPSFRKELSGSHTLWIVWEPAEEIEEEEIDDEYSFSQFSPTVSLNFHNAALTDVLRLLAEQNNLNIVASDDVFGVITVKLTDVNLGTALDAILKVNHYSWFIQDDVIVIKPVEDEMEGELVTKLYKLEYVDGDAIEDVLENILTGRGTLQVFSPVSQSMMMMGGGMGGMGGSMGGMGGSMGGMGGSMGGTGGGSAGSAGGAAGEGTQKKDHVLVSDMYFNFDKIERFIRELDVPVPQVNISVKFIETKLTLDERMGINWSLRSTLTGPQDMDGATYVDLAQFDNLRIATLSLPVFSSMIEILSTDNDTKLIQEPQVTTMNNTMASVSVGTSYPILVPQNVSSSSGDVFYSFEETEIEISMNVQPRINEGKYISMTISASVQALVGLAGPNADQPIVSDRSTSTQVTVADGETLLIGGLIFDQLIESETVVPFFSRIPLLKPLFSHKSTTTEQRELLVFITPSIVNLDN